MKQPAPSDFILFLHLQKTAGMTLQELLRRQYGPGLAKRSIRRLLKRSPEGLGMAEALSALSQKDKIFMGHFCFGVHRLLNFNTTYITFLRDPASRLISLYNFSANTPGAHYYKVAKDMTCEEFLFESKLLEMDNGMTRFLAGDEEDLFINRTPYGKCGHKMLEKALSNLDNFFSFVGIQEEFDRSLLLLAETFNWRNPCYVRLNTSRITESKPAAHEDLKIRIKECNQLDSELYAICKERFMDTYNSVFQDGDNALERFRMQNQKYQKWAKPLYQARSTIAGLIKKTLKGPRA
ncbi:sulfotransferase family 2 domain-containing protein [Oceanipulchritudo coccoides]|nr:sulfotransferase family 2 domain-containing protein [Oceanipulchritudo coccoides]